MRKSVIGIIAIILVPGIMSLGCNKTLGGGAIGAGAGGLIGGVIGKQTGNTATGAIIGAAVGGTAGAVIGKYMDKQAEEMKKDVGDAKIERVGEGIKVTFDSGILFKTGSSTLEQTAKTNIQGMSKVLNNYPDTNILIEGHTDSDGTEDFNQKLSERRAKAVADYAASIGVKASRITTVGRGETVPVASNDTAEGKQQNRRVEVAIMANDELKKKAEDGTIK
jgi:outer membrane protein OmpA-like peptidoglycan-associated protein